MLFEQLRKTIPDCVMILAPRHPERFGRVAQLLRNRNEQSVRRSNWMKRPAKIKAGTVVLLDSIGELASVYALASVAFVGGSLIPGGRPQSTGAGAVRHTGCDGHALCELPRHHRHPGQRRSGEAGHQRNAGAHSGDAAQRSRGRQHALGVRALEVFHHQSGATARATTALLRLLPQPHAAAS